MSESKTEIEKRLEAAWQWRVSRGVSAETEAYRVFHGPGEGRGTLQSFAMDRFADHYWITQWEAQRQEKEILGEIVEFLRKKGAQSCVYLNRPERGVPEEPVCLLGRAPEGRFEVREGGARFWIQLMGARHPGLFLDHAPLRRWLSARSHECRVLNTFSYTGSLCSCR